MLDLLPNAPPPTAGAADPRAEASRYRELVESLPAAVYTTDSEGRIELFNEAALALWGRRPGAEDRFWGPCIVLNAVGASLSPDRCPVRKVLQGFPAAHDAELMLELADASRRIVLANPRPIHDASGRVAGAFNTLVDITARKKAEAELAATKDELAAQVEGLTRLHELAMRLGGIADMPRAIRAILDTAVEAQDANFGLVWLQDDQSGDLVVHASRGFDDEKAFLFERVTPGPGGGAAGNAFWQKRRWIVEDVETDATFAPFRERARQAGFRAVHSTPIVTRSGALLGAISVHFARPHAPSQRDRQVADVCARHAADAIEAMRNQEALQESERLYRAIGESIDFGVWVCDGEGRATYLSESFLRLVGMTQQECAGYGWMRALHPDDAEATLQAWRRCVAGGGAWDAEHRVRGADGRWHAILSRGLPVRGAHGAVVAWAGINLDIDRLKRVETELRDLDQRKNEFLATLAHELRNPLAPLRNGLELLRLCGDPATSERTRLMMDRQLRQMVRLVDDLLDVSRVSRGKIELRREDVELAAVLRMAVEASQPLMAERGHQLMVELACERVLVHADATRLAQVFCNLLNNAARYTDRGGRVLLEARMLDGEAVVRVRDNGMGIPPGMQARIFDIFTQADRTLEKAQGGLGIGLSICKRLVEMHGGRIEVMSGGRGMGSEFIVRVPARAGALSQGRGKMHAGA